MDSAEGEAIERDIESGIIRSFGHSIIDFELILFQKFLNMSGPHSVTTEAIFRKHLTLMHAKGFQQWKRLIPLNTIHWQANYH